MTYKEALEKIATVNAMDYEYQAWAREALAKQEQPYAHEAAMYSNDRMIVDPQTGYVSIGTIKQEQSEPVAWMDGNELIVRIDWVGKLDWKESWVDVGRAIPNKWTPVLYTTPQQRTWVGLTDMERHEIMICNYARTELLAHAIEAKLKEKNT
jgi:hypothetical protein